MSENPDFVLDQPKRIQCARYASRRFISGNEDNRPDLLYNDIDILRINMSMWPKPHRVRSFVRRANSPSILSA